MRGRQFSHTVHAHVLPMPAVDTKPDGNEIHLKTQWFPVFWQIGMSLPLDCKDITIS